MDGRSFRTREWPSGYRVEALYTAVFIGGLMAIFWLIPFPREADRANVLWFLAFLFSVLAAGELAGFVIMRRYGARPRLTPRLQFKPIFNSWLLAEGHPFTRAEFAVIGLVSALAELAVAASSLLFATLRGLGLYLVLLVVLAEGRSVWYSVSALLRPTGTLIEQGRDGAILHEPARHDA